jgi:hypothetical protein
LKFLQPPPSPWMNQRPLGVDVNVGMFMLMFSGCCPRLHV